MAFATSLAQAQQTPDSTVYTVDTCYRLALARSKTVAGQAQLIEQAEARINQARAAFAPTLSAGATWFRQEAATTSAFSRELSPASQDTVRASATQNLFKGFRDMSTLQQREFSHRAAELGRQQAEVQLYIDVTQAFYEVLVREAQLESYRQEIAAGNERRQELLELRRSARARTSDIATVEAAIATLEGAIANTQGLLGVARETMAFLTGLSADARLADDQNADESLPPMDFWLERITARPDVQQAQANVAASERNISVARAGGGPSVDMSANYYFTRPNTAEGVDWDVQLTLSQPLFTGGLVRSQVREAASQHSANEIALAQAQETAERDIRSLYQSLRASMEQTTTFGRAVELTERNYRLLRQDNRAGLTSNLDVLQALANVYQTRRAWENARYATKSNRARLNAISARLETTTSDTTGTR